MEIQAGMSAGPNPVALDPSMQKLAQQKRQLIRDLKASGRLQSATILNFNPFPLFVEAGRLIPHRVKAASIEQPVQKFVITEPRFSFIYRTTELKDNRVARKNYQVQEILPIIQAFEFFNAWSDESRGDTGGVVVFEGIHSDITRKGLKVNIPYLQVAEDGLPYVALKEDLLADAIERALQQQKRSILAKVQQAMEYADDPGQVSYIQNPHRIAGRWAFAQGWVPVLPSYVMQQTTSSDFCPRCKEQVKTGSIMCKCGHAFNVLEAYKNAYIEFGNVQMDRMSAKEWQEAKLLNAERKKNRGE
jgi:hypothetical protein